MQEAEIGFQLCHPLAKRPDTLSFPVKWDKVDVKVLDPLRRLLGKWLCLLPWK